MKKPPFLLGTDEVAFLQAALAEHEYPHDALSDGPVKCGGANCDVICQSIDGYDEHIAVVAFTAGMRFQGTPTEDSTIIWMCVRPDCRERITVPKSVWASHPDEVMATLAELVTEHNDSVHSVNATPSGLLLP